MCTKFQVDIMENDRILVFWRSKTVIFHAVHGDFRIFPSFIFSRFGPFKKCSRVIFRVLDGKLTQKHVSRRPNPKFSVWPFLDLVTLNMLTESLGWYLEVSQTRSMSMYWLIFISYGSSARQIQILKVVKHFDFDLACDVISDPEVNNVRFPLINFPNLSNAVWIL